MTDEQKDLEAIGPIIARTLDSILEGQASMTETDRALLSIIQKHQVALEICLSMVSRLSEVLGQAAAHIDRPDLQERIVDSLSMASEVLKASKDG